MGLCKCQKRKVTNLFCFEHDVNVCEDCLVADHERCIVQSYVQWLQDSDYNPICILCKNLLKDEPTVRLSCYDVFHWSCLDKYMEGLPANTAPAGYQCPKCKEGLFPSPNIVSPVVDILRKKLESVEWSRVGLGQSLLQINESLNIQDEISDLSELEIQKQQVVKKSLNGLEDESNGFVIVSEQQQNRSSSQEKLIDNTNDTSSQFLAADLTPTVKKTKNIKPSKPNREENVDLVMPLQKNILSHNRTQINEKDVQRDMESSYDPSLGVVLNITNLDRDTGEYKYQRRPVFEWFNRWIKSRQITSRIRMTRQKKILFIIIMIFVGFFTLIIIMTRLGELNTHDDPAFDPLNNPNIHIE